MKTVFNNSKNLKQIAIACAITLFSNYTQAQNKIPWYESKNASRGAFGPDTRAEAKAKWEYKDYMRATSTAVKAKNVNGDKIYCGTLATYIRRAFGDYTISSSVKFLDQPTAGFCTGFLIAPDLLVTAGHCIQTETDLQNTIWIFDYTSDVAFNRSEGYISIPERNQYRGVEILDTKLAADGSYDYCIIRLDRKADRKPFKFRTGGAVDFEDIIAMIGSPSGLPLKVADSAHVTNTEDYTTSFLTDLDAFHGNSGGPVFNMKGFIEGILVRGPGWDFHLDSATNSIVQDEHWDLYSFLGMQAARGNGVHKITALPSNLITGAIYRNLEVAITDGNLEEFNEWTIYKWIFKTTIDGKDNLAALAAKANQPAMLETILGMPGVDMNQKDRFSTPLLHLMAINNMGSAIALAAKGEGLDINIRNSNGETALMVAAQKGNIQAAEALLRAGADPKLVNYAGKSARSLAKTNKHKDLASILKKAEKGKFK